MPPDPSKTSPAAIEQETSPKPAAQGMRAIREPMANFFFTLYSFNEKSSLQLFFPCLPLPGFCLPTVCLSVLLRSTATEHQRRHFRWVELHTLASRFQVELTEKSGVDAVIFFHTFRLVPVPGGSSWGWSWSRWAHAGREFGSCQSLIAQDSCRCESRLFKGHRSLDELPAHPASKATYVSNCFLYNQQVLMRLARVRHEYT